LRSLFFAPSHSMRASPFSPHRLFTYTFLHALMPLEPYARMDVCFALDRTNIQ
jgi:hypothetical protein